MRTAARRDIAEAGIVAALAPLCEDIVRISSPNAPDLLVRYRGRWTPLAVKTPKIGRLTKGEQVKPSRWPVVKTPEEALQAIGCHEHKAVRRHPYPVSCAGCGVTVMRLSRDWASCGGKDWCLSCANTL